MVPNDVPIPVPVVVERVTDVASTNPPNRTVTLPACTDNGEGGGTADWAWATDDREDASRKAVARMAKRGEDITGKMLLYLLVYGDHVQPS